MSEHCKFAFDHSPGEACQQCNLAVDSYGNTEADFRNCCFPDCGCDGQRLCMAPSGPNHDSIECNVEGIYGRKDYKARAAKMKLVGLCLDRKKEVNDAPK